jgi:integrase
MDPKRPKSKEWPKTVTAGHASVTVYRNAHHGTKSGWIFVVAWNTPAGRKREKFSSSSEAIAEARTKAAQLNAGRIEGASMTTGDRDELAAARKLANGTPVLSALTEWAQANQLTTGNVLAAAKAWAARTGKVETRVKVAEVVKQFLKAKTAAGKNVATDHADSFRRMTADLGELSIDTVSARQIDAWLARWDHPVTRNTNRKRIVSVWRWAQRKGFLPRDARTEAEMTDMAHEPAPEIGIIGVRIWRSLLDHFRATHPELLPALILAGFCGLRRSEIHAQTWEDISIERKNLRVTQGKRGTPARRLVPLCDAAIEWLMLCASRRGFICPTIKWKGKAKQSLALDGVRRISSEAKGPDGEPLFPALPENCFRHSYISHAVAASGDIPRVSLNAGNSVKEVNRHYRELVTEEEGKAWFDSEPGALGQVLPMEKTANS